MASTTNTSGGTTTSFSNTPQAKTTSLNDGERCSDYRRLVPLLSGRDGERSRGNAKVLWSLDDGGSASTATKVYAPVDLLTQDAKVEATSADYSAKGAHIWITSDGKVGYDASTFSAAMMASLQALGVGQTLTDSFTYAIRLGNGTLSWATAKVQFSGLNGSGGGRCGRRHGKPDADDRRAGQRHRRRRGHVFTLNSGSAPADKGTASVVSNQVEFNPGPASITWRRARPSTSRRLPVPAAPGALSSSTVLVTITGTNVVRWRWLIWPPARKTDADDRHAGQRHRR